MDVPNKVPVPVRCRGCNPCLAQITQKFKTGEVTELAESTGLENRRRATYRGFESHPLRHIKQTAQQGGFFMSVWLWIRTVRIPLHRDVQVPWSPGKGESGHPLRHIKQTAQQGGFFML